MNFEEAYTTVHNMAAQYEALNTLKAHLESAKNVEKYIKESEGTIRELESKIQDLKQASTKLDKEILDRKSRMDSEEQDRIQKIQEQIRAMQDRATHEQSEEVKRLDSEVAQKKGELGGLSTLIEQKSKLNRELDEETSRRKHELKTVKDNLVSIRNSIGG